MVISPSIDIILFHFGYGWLMLHRKLHRQEWVDVAPWGVAMILDDETSAVQITHSNITGYPIWHLQNSIQFSSYHAAWPFKPDPYRFVSTCYNPSILILSESGVTIWWSTMKSYPYFTFKTLNFISSWRYYQDVQSQKMLSRSMYSSRLYNNL